MRGGAVHKTETDKCDAGPRTERETKLTPRLRTERGGRCKAGPYTEHGDKYAAESCTEQEGMLAAELYTERVRGGVVHGTGGNAGG